MRGQLVSDGTAAGIHQQSIYISRMFQSVDLFQLRYNPCIPVVDEFQ